MLFSKTKCNNCNHDIDEALSFCPFCRKEIENNREDINHAVTWVDTRRQIFLLIMGFIGLQLISILVTLIAAFICNQITHDPEATQEMLKSTEVGFAINASAYVLTFLGLALIIWPYIKMFLHQFKSLKRLVKGLAYGAIAIGFSCLYSLFVSIFYKTSGNINQQSLVLMINRFPVLALLVFGIIGPICEELTYRVGLFNFMLRTKRWIAYLVEILLFALIHFNYQCTTQTEWINELINLPDYIIGGLVLTYAYEKDGFATSTYAHILNNVVSIIVIIIIK